MQKSAAMIQQLQQEKGEVERKLADALNAHEQSLAELETLRKAVSSGGGVNPYQAAEVDRLKTELREEQAARQQLSAQLAKADLGKAQLKQMTEKMKGIEMKHLEDLRKQEQVNACR